MTFQSAKPLPPKRSDTHIPPRSGPPASSGLGWVRRRADWIFARLTEGRHEGLRGVTPLLRSKRGPFGFGCLGCVGCGHSLRSARASLALLPPGVPTGPGGMPCAGLRIWWGLRFCAQKRADRDPPHVSQSWTCLTARQCLTPRQPAIVSVRTAAISERVPRLSQSVRMPWSSRGRAYGAVCIRWGVKTPVCREDGGFCSQSHPHSGLMFSRGYR
jgi:hypothetical protein